MNKTAIAISKSRMEKSGPSGSSGVKSRRSPILMTPRLLLQIYNSSTIDSTGKKARIIRRKGVRMKAVIRVKETVISRYVRKRRAKETSSFLMLSN